MGTGKKTLRQAINEAIDKKDAVAAGKIVDFLRFGGCKTKEGTPVVFTYNDCVGFFGKERPDFTRDDFEDLMLQAEAAEAGA